MPAKKKSAKKRDKKASIKRVEHPLVACRFESPGTLKVDVSNVAQVSERSEQFKKDLYITLKVSEKDYHQFKSSYECHREQALDSLFFLFQ